MVKKRGNNGRGSVSTNQDALEPLHRKKNAGGTRQHEPLHVDPNGHSRCVSLAGSAPTMRWLLSCARSVAEAPRIDLRRQ